MGCEPGAFQPFLLAWDDYLSVSAQGTDEVVRLERVFAAQLPAVEEDERPVLDDMEVVGSAVPGAILLRAASLRVSHRERADVVRMEVHADTYRERDPDRVLPSDRKP